MNIDSSFFHTNKQKKVETTLKENQKLKNKQKKSNEYIKMTYETRKHSKTFSASNAYALLGLLLTCLPCPLHFLLPPPNRKKKPIEHVYHAFIKRKSK